MRLINRDAAGNLRLTQDLTEENRRKIGRYAILSHTWGKQEVKFQEFEAADKRKEGYRKIEFCSEQAQKEEEEGKGIDYCWVDTCCIDKRKKEELERALRFMFLWYRESAKCYVYLSDVDLSDVDLSDPSAQHLWEPRFRQSRWFTRGWTLQELLAPEHVDFYSRDGKFLGDKIRLKQLINNITGLPVEAIDGTAKLGSYSIDCRYRWRGKRDTTEPEDIVYCLLGILNLHITADHGEGEEKALERLQEAYHTHCKYPDSIYRSLGDRIRGAPFLEPTLFRGRHSELEHMSQVLRPNSPSGNRSGNVPLVLGGTGGIGKTQLALEYLRIHKGDYESRFWVNAASENQLRQRFKEIASDIYHGTPAYGQDEVSEVLKWLSHDETPRWVMIFDNYDPSRRTWSTEDREPGHFNDPESFDLRKYLPKPWRGTIIVTTRYPEDIHWQNIQRTRIDVDELKDFELNLDILQTRSKRKLDRSWKQLAKSCQGRPLALAAVGSHLCKRSECTFEEYLKEYKARYSQLEEVPISETGYDQRMLFTTWDLLYGLLKRENEPEPGLAAKFLRLLAFFDHQAFWYELFSRGATGLSPPWLSKLLDDEEKSRRTFEKIMNKLWEFGFVDKVHERSRLWIMHARVHDWALERLNERIDTTHYWYAASCVTGTPATADAGWQAPRDYNDASLVPHAYRLLHASFDGLRGNTDNFEQLVHVGEFLHHHFQYRTAERMFQRSLSMWEQPSDSGQISGSNPDSDPRITFVRNTLGNVYQHLREFDMACEMFSAALRGRRAENPNDEASILETTSNLGAMLHEVGRWDEAGIHLSEAVKGRKARSENDPPDSEAMIKAARSMQNLARLRASQGRWVEADRLLCDTVETLQRAGGGQLEETTALNSLGGVNWEMSKAHAQKRVFFLQKAKDAYGKAVSAWEDGRLLDEQQKTVPSYLMAVQNLGRVHSALEEHEGAESRYKQAFEGYAKIGHVDIFRAALMYGRYYMNADRFDDAEGVFADAIAMLERKHPLEHAKINELKWNGKECVDAKKNL